MQETFIRAWRAIDRFEGRSQLRSWLYKIATNVCLDMLSGRERRARPIDLGPSHEPVEESLNSLPEATWVQPIPDPACRRGIERDDAARARRRAPAPPAPPAGRPHPLRGPALEGERGRGAARHERRVREQRAPAGAGHARGEQPRAGRRARARSTRPTRSCSRATSRRSRRTTWTRSPSLIQEDAIQSMPPFDMWLQRPRRHLHVVVRPRHRLQGLAA